MPSKSPPHSPPQMSTLDWWIATATPQGRTPLLNRSAVVAATMVSFLVVAGAFAWIVAHPLRAAHPSEPIQTATVAVLSPPPSAMTTPPPPPPPPLALLPAVHRPERTDVMVNRIPSEAETPPPLPPPISPPQSADPPPNANRPVAAPPPVGETYGTQVLFLNNPVVAEETAKREKKLLFVMHISGNFENSCFT